MRSQIFAASTVAALTVLGFGVALDSACSPSSNPTNTDAGPVCDPQSTDDPLAGCACDPGTFKTSDCYTGPPSTEAKGICKTGKRSCTAQGTYTSCEGEVTPQPEICNYADDDCNGLVDDLPEIEDAGALAYCTSPACDNGGFTDAAITCWGPDPGICGAGTKACKGGPGGGTPNGCNEFIHGGAPEVCNGIDDDCNGAVDDGLDNEGACDMPNQSTWPDGSDPFEAGADGSLIVKVYGECVHGQLACDDGGDKCYPSQPTSETQQYGEGCDGLDNDCNGVIDDHACADSYDLQYGYTYCCNDGTYYTCDSKANIGDWTSCKLAN